jgi:hypothetical protein
MTLGRRYLKTLWLPNLHSVLILLMYSWPAARGSLWVLRLRVIEYPNSLTNTEWEVNDDTHYITARTAFQHSAAQSQHQTGCAGVPPK